MSLLGLFDIGKSAVFASQTALNVVSNNIANVNTEGYSRHEIVLDVRSPIEVKGQFIGRGVNISGVRRHYDRFTHLQIIGQNNSYGRSKTMEQGLSHIEQIFNDALNLGLSDPLKNYFNSWHDVASSVESEAQKNELIQNAETLVRRARQMEGDVLDTLDNINIDIENVVNRINTVTGKISTMNEKITQLEAGLSREQASYFRDERDRQLNELAELMEYTWYEDQNGAVDILVGGKSLVNAEKSYQMTSQTETDGNRDVYMFGENITSVFPKGQLGGLIAVRNDIESNPIFNLRKLVASLAWETNEQHKQGFGVDGSTGTDFFNPLQIYTSNDSTAGSASASVGNYSALTLDEYDINMINGSNGYEVYNRQTGALVTSGTGTSISFDGIDVTLSGTLASGDSFLISPLTGVIENLAVNITDVRQIATADTDPTITGEMGNNVNALAIAQLDTNSISSLGGTTFDEYYSGIVSTVGILSKAATDSLTYDDNLLFELKKKRDDVSGVSLDEEAANLIRFQRAFEAGARIIKVTDELLELVINL